MFKLSEWELQLSENIKDLLISDVLVLKYVILIFYQKSKIESSILLEMLRNLCPCHGCSNYRTILDISGWNKFFFQISEILIEMCRYLILIFRYLALRYPYKYSFSDISTAFTSYLEFDVYTCIYNKLFLCIEYGNATGKESQVTFVSEKRIELTKLMFSIYTVASHIYVYLIRMTYWNRADLKSNTVVIY